MIFFREQWKFIFSLGAAGKWNHEKNELTREFKAGTYADRKSE